MGKAVHHHNNGTSHLIPTPNPIEYVDNVIEIYVDEVTRRLNDMAKCGKGSHVPTKHLVSANILSDSTDKLA